MARIKYINSKLKQKKTEKKNKNKQKQKIEWLLIKKNTAEHQIKYLTFAG